MRGGNVGQTVASGSGQGGGTVASGNHVVRGIVFAALGGICWGFSGTCAQLMTSRFGVPVSWFTCVRLLLSYGYQFCGNVEIRSRFGRVKHRAVFERVL